MSTDATARIGESDGPHVGTVDRAAWREILADVAVGLVGGGLRPPFAELEPGDRANLVRILEKLELVP